MEVSIFKVLINSHINSDYLCLVNDVLKQYIDMKEAFKNPVKR